MIDESTNCPCGSNQQFKQCCQLLLSGKKIADSPLELMRSRYTAHVCKNMDYIIKTMQGRALKLFDRESTQAEWFDKCEWQKLEIIEAKDDMVEFRAHYTLDGESQVLHERSKFSKLNNSWYFVSGQNKAADIRISDKVGRNDPCSCGSGKKFKKCCA